jgi:ribosome-interacting GTPase 1
LRFRLQGTCLSSLLYRQFTLQSHHLRLLSHFSLSLFCRPKGKLPDYDEPVVVSSKRCTVEDFCNRLHKAIAKQLKYALVWGASVKHRPQRVGKEHVLQDEDIVQLVKRI